jgi:hypothetical protein
MSSTCGSAIVSAMLCVHLPRGFGVVERAVYFDTGHGE